MRLPRRLKRTPLRRLLDKIRSIRLVRGLRFCAVAVIVVIGIPDLALGTPVLFRLDDPGNGLTDSDVLGLSDDGRTAVGRIVTAEGRRAFRWTIDGGIDLFDSQARRANDISADGSIIIGRTTDKQAFSWTESGGLQRLGFRGSAEGISDSSSVRLSPL